MLPHCSSSVRSIISTDMGCTEQRSILGKYSLTFHLRRLQHTSQSLELSVQSVQFSRVFAQQSSHSLLCNGIGLVL